MALSDVTDRRAVLMAISEYDALGKPNFLTKYGFGESRGYWLQHKGRLYDSKAVVGAAHGFQHGQPLRASDFSGGAATVRQRLQSLGFDVVTETSTAESALSTSTQLEVGAVYTRADLMEQFGIRDATINTGVFRPEGSRSIWLFITRKKPNDRTQYEDLLDGDTLYWQGQTSGRTDKLIIGHESHGLELLVFYRAEKYEHPKAGFRYNGPFRYVSSSGENPKNFVLERVLAVTEKMSAQDALFSPESVEDGRQKTLAAIHRRQGQGAFRAAVLAAYGRRCAVTGCDVEAVLEAAHIYPYRGVETNHVGNGLLLRADIHTLFDLGLLAVDTQTMALTVASALAGTEYAKLAGTKLFIPVERAHRPSMAALDKHRHETFIDAGSTATPEPAEP